MVDLLAGKNNYSDFPRRIILHSPFKQSVIKSYGIILYAKDTGRWLLVQRNHSPEYVELLRGSYIHSNIPILLAGIDKSELFSLKRILLENNSERKKKYFAIEFYSTLHTGSIDQGYSKLLDNHNILADSVHDIIPLHDYPEWLWPKGRSSKTDKSQHSTALREFEEESKISARLINPLIINGNYTIIVESYVGRNSRIYTTKLWIYTIDREYYPFQSKKITFCSGKVNLNFNNIDSIDIDYIKIHSDPKEIKDVRWVTYDNACEMLKESKKHALMKAKKYIDSTF